MTTNQTLTFAQRIKALRLTECADSISGSPRYLFSRTLGHSYWVPVSLTKHRANFVSRGGALYTRPPKASGLPAVTSFTNISLDLRPNEKLTPERCQALIQEALKSTQQPARTPASRLASVDEVSAYHAAEEKLLAWCEKEIVRCLQKQQKDARKWTQNARNALLSCEKREKEAQDALNRFWAERGLADVPETPAAT